MLSHIVFYSYVFIFILSLALHTNRPSILLSLFWKVSPLFGKTLVAYLKCCGAFFLPFGFSENMHWCRGWEIVRKQQDIRLVTTEERRNDLVSEPNYHTTTIISHNLLAIEMKITHQKTRLFAFIYIRNQINSNVWAMVRLRVWCETKLQRKIKIMLHGRCNFSLVAHYPLKFTRCSLLVVNHPLPVAKFARYSLKSCSFQKITQYSLQNFLVTRCRSYFLQKITR